MYAIRSYYAHRVKGRLHEILEEVRLHEHRRFLAQPRGAGFLAFERGGRVV